MLFCLLVRRNPVVKTSNNAALTNAADLRRCIRMAKSVDMLCSLGRNEPENHWRMACKDGSIIANPYAGLCRSTDECKI